MDTASSPPTNGAPPPPDEDEAAAIVLVTRATELLRQRRDPPASLQELDRLLDSVRVTARNLLVHASAGVESTGNEALYELSYDRFINGVTVDYFGALGERYEWDFAKMAAHAGYSRKDALVRVLEKHDLLAPYVDRYTRRKPRK